MTRAANGTTSGAGRIAKTVPVLYGIDGCTIGGDDGLR